MPEKASTTVKIFHVLRAPHMLVIAVSFMILSCSSEDIGPSDNKVSLDVEEKIHTISNGLVSVTDFKIVKRDVLSEDRVKFHLTQSYKMEQEEIEQYEASGKRSSLIFGGFGPSMKPVIIDQQMDGKTEDATWLYRLRGNGIW